MYHLTLTRPVFRFRFVRGKIKEYLAELASVLLAIPGMPRADCDARVCVVRLDRAECAGGDDAVVRDFE